MKKKDLNKLLVSIFIGTAIGGIGIFAKTKKGKGFFQKLKQDISLGLKEMKSSFANLIRKNDKKK